LSSCTTGGFARRDQLSCMKFVQSWNTYYNVFQHAVALTYHLYTFISVFNASDMNVYK
jgi:hypothetical protein